MLAETSGLPGNALDPEAWLLFAAGQQHVMDIQRRTFLRQFGVGVTGASLLWPKQGALAATLFGTNRLPRSTPEEQGVSSDGVLSFLAAVSKSRHEFHSFMLVRHGHVVAEGWWAPYGPRLNHMLYSLSKSFTSTAVGFAVHEGKLSVEDKVISFFPNDVPEQIGDNLKALRVRHLLTMSVGHADDSTGHITKTSNWSKAFLALPIPHEPGTRFLYNSGATYMLSAIVQKVSGRRVLDYLTPRLFEPLDIQRATWEVCPQGINTGGWGLSVTTEALSRFGQLYLDKGLWKGKRLLPTGWVEEATSFKIQQPAPDLERAKRESDWHQGYCYQFWRCRHNAFRGDGAFGQFMVVMPEQDAVLAITSETADMQGILNLAWDHLLEGMHGEPLQANHQAHAQLRRTLSQLALQPPHSSPSSNVEEKAAGKKFKLKPNSMRIAAVVFSFEREQTIFSVVDEKGTHSITCGREHWVKGETDMPGTPPKLTVGELGPRSRVAGSGTWIDTNTYQMTWRFFETPHHDTVTCRFEGDGVRLEFMNSLTQISSAHKELRPVLEGSLA